MEELISLLLVMMWFSSLLETRLKNNLPSTFKREIGRKSLILIGLGGLALGIYTSVATLHWTGTKQCFKHKPKILKRNEQICGQPYKIVEVLQTGFIS